VDVKQFGKVRRTWVWDHVLDDEYSATWRCRLALVLQNLDAFIVIPVVQDQLHHVCVGLGSGLEHIPSHVLAPVAHSQFACPEAGGIRDDLRSFQDCSLEARILRQEPGQHIPMTAAHVAQVRDLGEVVGPKGIEHPVRLSAGIAAHRVVEHPGIARILNGVIEGHATKLTHEGVLFPVLNHPRQVFPQRIMFGAFF
jgi:hypothetical protein